MAFEQIDAVRSRAPEQCEESEQQKQQRNLSSAVWEELQNDTSQRTEIEKRSRSLSTQDNLDLEDDRLFASIFDASPGETAGHGAAKDSTSSRGQEVSGQNRSGGDPGVSLIPDSGSCRPEVGTSAGHRPDVDSYTGEVINRAAEPTMHQVRRGETLEVIAADHLGPGASRVEIERHAREIAHVNNLGSNARPTPGRHLSLPGHTDNGGFVTFDASGYRRTVWRNGVVRMEGRDGSGYVRNADGSEQHWGPRPTDNYTRTVDGRYVPADQRQEGQSNETAIGPIGPERQRLDRILDSESANMKPEELVRFRLDMETFDRRARSQRPPLSDAEIERTYAQISRLIEAPNQVAPPFDRRQRLYLASEVMHHSADPTTVDQGAHGTCNVASLESRMYTRTPWAAAGLVADVATTGSFRTTGGRFVHPRTEDIVNYHESTSMPESARSHASQIFQMTAVNSHYQYHGVRDNLGNEITPAGTARYEQWQPVAGTTPDTGERVVDYSTGVPIVRAIDPAVATADLDDISYQISGQRESGFALVHPLPGVGDGVHDEDQTDEASTWIRDRGAVPIRSEQELRERLSSMKREGRLPAIIEIHTQNEPFWRDSYFGQAGGSGGHHNVTVTDYDEATGRVSVDNQWGEESDHIGSGAMHVSDLFRAMRDPTPNQGSSASIEALEREVEWNRLHNRPSGFKELELLRLRRDADRVRTPQEEDEYDRAIIRVMREAQERWRRQERSGEMTQEQRRERERTLRKYHEMLTVLRQPPGSSANAQAQARATARVARIERETGIPWRQPA